MQDVIKIGFQSALRDIGSKADISRVSVNHLLLSERRWKARNALLTEEHHLGVSLLDVRFLSR